MGDRGLGEVGDDDAQLRVSVEDVLDSARLVGGRAAAPRSSTTTIPSFSTASQSQEWASSSIRSSGWSPTRPVATLSSSFRIRNPKSSMERLSASSASGAHGSR